MLLDIGYYIWKPSGKLVRNLNDYPFENNQAAQSALRELKNAPFKKRAKVVRVAAVNNYHGRRSVDGRRVIDVETAKDVIKRSKRTVYLWAFGDCVESVRDRKGHLYVFEDTLYPSNGADNSKHVKRRELVAPSAAAAKMGLNRKTLYNWIRANRVEYTRAPSGRLMVYADSLYGSDSVKLTKNDGVLLTIDEYTAAEGISRRTVYNRIRSGRLNHVKTAGGRIRTVL